MSDQIKNYSLWEKYKKDEDQEARQKIILDNLSLVKYHAGRISMLVPEFIEKQDLESFGVIGLLEAVENFDHTRNIEFKTYASNRVRGAIMDHLRSLDWLPDSIRRQGKLIKKKITEIKAKKGRKPDSMELAKELNLSQEKVKRICQMLYSSNWVSLYQESGEGQLSDFISGAKEEEPENVFAQKEAEAVLTEALEKLTRQQYLVISLFYFEELTQKEIARTLDLSPARISQIHKKAIFRLRGFLSSKKQKLVGI
ncbi:MAG: sigma-70 family RNA polymerase sigma factor [Halanaerobiaceae bacterium]